MPKKSDGESTVTVQSDSVVLQPVQTLQPRPTSNATGLAKQGEIVEKGNYTLVALDKNGEEVPNSEFTYPAGARFEKTFANNPNFKIKKKP